MRRRFISNKNESNNIIRYTSTDGNVVVPYVIDFGAPLISNTYTDKGLMVFKSNVTSIGDHAFSDCLSLTSIQIPNSVTSIGDGAFTYCESLASIVVDGGNTIYDSRNGCNAIIEITSNTLIAGCKNTIIPDGVTSIGDRAFNGCSGLSSIEIPNSVTSIGDRVFYGCSSLSSVYVKPKTPPTLGSYSFDKNAPDLKIYVPRASLNAYKTASGWRDYASAIVPYDY